MTLLHCPATILVQRGNETLRLKVDLAGVLGRALDRHPSVTRTVREDLTENFGWELGAVVDGLLPPPPATAECLCAECKHFRRDGG